jgi:NADH-quinone oxidoreductase subunit N
VLTSTETVGLLLPEIVLAAVATFIYIAGTLCDCRRAWTWVALAGLAAAAVMLYRQPVESAFNGPLAADTLGLYVRWLSLGVGALLVLLSARSAAEGQAPEIMGSLLLLITGLMLVSIGGELVLLFTGLELVSIPTYVLLYLGRRDAASQEATTKYFFLSILSSALLLYGFSFLYGLGGTTVLKDIAQRLSAGGISDSLRPLAVLAVVLVFAGLSFRIGAVPFHFYAPDVYQGTTQGNAAMLSIVTKIAGLVALVRIISLGLPGMEGVGWRVALILSMLTMTLGNTLALWQDNVRRLLAYSSIAHAGYLLIGVAVGFATADRGNALGATGLGAMLFYLTVYAIATAGAFAVLDCLGNRDRPVDSVNELAGVGRTHPLAGVAMSLFMFSLTGVPPLAGFFGKLTLLFGAVGQGYDAQSGTTLNGWFLALAVVAVLNSAISAAYYLRIVAAMYFRSPLASLQSDGGSGAWWAMFISALAVLALGILPGPVQQANDAARHALLSVEPDPSADSSQMAATDSLPVRPADNR